MTTYNFRRTIMTRGISLFSVVCICFALCISAGFAQEGMPEMTPEQMEAMQKWQEAATPGENHAWMQKFVGNWTSTTKSWWEPGGEPMEMTSSTTCEMMFDGRFMHMQVMMDWMGQKVPGVGYMGYDNMEKMYSVLWIDGMGTAMFMANGSREGDKLVCHGTMDDPASGGMNKPVRVEWEFSDADHMVFSMYDMAGTDKEFLAMQETASRVKE
jgi:hypothetical protein